jgi:tetratricopeptide (TPR) repeat protein
MAIVGVLIVATVLGYFLFSAYMERRREVVARELYDIAFRRTESGDFEGALKYLEKVIRANPNYADAYCLAGICYNAMGEYQKSIEAYKQAVKIAPDHTTAHDGLGLVFARSGRHEEAIQFFREITRIDPDYAFGYFKLGFALGQLDHYEEAIQAVRKSISLNSNYSPAYQLLGVIYNKLGRYDEGMFRRLDTFLGWCAERQILAHPSLFVGGMSGGTFWPRGKDGRNLYAPERMKALGFEYVSIGRR